MSPERGTLSSPGNRRRCRRRKASGQLRVECRRGATGLGRNLAVCPLDVSETGARLVVCQTLHVGEEVEVLLACAGVRRHLKRLGRVIWCLPLTEPSTCCA